MADGAGAFFTSPWTQLGMGVLAGNRGQSGSGAFSNAMGSGLNALQQANMFGLAQQRTQVQDQLMQQQLMRERQEAERARRMQHLGPALMKGLMSDSPETRQQAQVGVTGVDPKLLSQMVLNQQKMAMQAAMPQPPQKPTSEMQNLAAGGYSPGSEPFQQAMRHRLGLIEAPPGPAGFKDSSSLRKEYTAQSGGWRAARTAFERMEASEPTGVGDISLLIGYMKMLDPTSVVREGEFATAANAGGVPDMIRGLYNKAIAGDKLSPELRSKFMSQAGALLDQQRALQLRREGEYTGIAHRANMLKADTIPDFIGRYREGITLPAPPEAPKSPGYGAEIDSEVDRLMKKYLP